MKFSCREGEFKILRPCRSVKGYYIVGAIVGSDKKGMTYTKKVLPTPDFRTKCLEACYDLRDKIIKDQPGIKEIYGEQ